MSKLILMTGISGFMGSALAARLLEEDIKILYLTSNVKDMERARELISDIYKKSEMEKDLDNTLELIQCENLYSISDVEQTLKDIEADEVWHVAAHMSYDFKELPKSIKFNSIITTNIMKALKKCNRFYFISTTGVAGLGDVLEETKIVPETLLTDFDSLNPYTTSKVLAEYMLWNQSIESNIPLTIIRPGSIIGDSNTGWSNGTKFGYYSYLYPLKKFRKKDITFYLNVDPNKKFPIVHINHLIDLCCNLRNRKEDKFSVREIFHGCNTNLFTAAEHFKIFEEVSSGNIKIGYGEGEVGFNKVFNQMNEDNNRFLGVNCTYSNEKLIEALGEDNIPPDLTRESIAKVMESYLQ